MDIDVLGLTREKVRELYDTMFTDLESQHRPMTDTEGLKYIRDASWTLEEKLAVLASIKTYDH